MTSEPESAEILDQECRSCGEARLRPVLSLGNTPLADGLRRAEELDQPEARYPLEVAFCEACTLVQILHQVDPEELFCRDYPYYSSFSDQLLRHAATNALEVMQERQLNGGSLVVELASNDGYLLRNFVEAGVPVLGIDPAEGPAQAAREIGVPTRCEFFTVGLARKLVAEGQRADAIFASNVLAHVPDLNGFVEGIATLLQGSGVAVLEVPSVRELVRHGEFDTIYHEHLCYFSVTALDKLFRRHGLFLNRVVPLEIHGGSLRLFVEKRQAPEESVRSALARDSAEGLTRWEYYRDFAGRVEDLKAGLRRLLQDLKAKGARIAAYGAAAKGATLLNYTGIGRECLDFVVDRNVHKQGRFMPGVHLPIRPPEALMEEKPDFVLLLAWNFQKEIVAQQEDYRNAGGRFIVPIPSPRILGHAAAQTP